MIDGMMERVNDRRKRESRWNVFVSEQEESR